MFLPVEYSQGREVIKLRTRYALSVEKLSPEQISDIDRKFTEAGWVIGVTTNTVGSHNFRNYIWESTETEPVYPDGFEQRTELQPIEMNHFPRAVD